MKLHDRKQLQETESMASYRLDLFKFEKKILPPTSIDKNKLTWGLFS